MRTKTKNATGSLGNEKGNVFFFILLGVVLFAALSYMIAKGMRSQTSNMMTERQVELAVSEILGYAQNIQRAVDKVRRSGCSENDISFHHNSWGHADYQHTPTSPDKCKIYHPDGGGMLFFDLSKIFDQYIDYTNRFIYVGRSAISGIGTTCTDSSCVELYMFLRMHHAENLCAALNDALGVSPNLPLSGGIYGTPRFNGEFTYGNTLSTPSLIGKRTACYQDNSETFSDGTSYYDFYYILVNR